MPVANETHRERPPDISTARVQLPSQHRHLPAGDGVVDGRLSEGRRVPAGGVLSGRLRLPLGDGVQSSARGGSNRSGA